MLGKLIVLVVVFIVVGLVRAGLKGSKTERKEDE
jgi:hypothetical protein